MKILGIVPALTAFTFTYALFVLLVIKEAIEIEHSIEIVSRFNVRMNETLSSEQKIDKKIKEEISALENKTIKSSELQVAIENIFERIVKEFSKNDTKISYTFSISITKVNNETNKVLVKYKINIEVIEQYFYIRSEVEGEKGVVVNLLEDFAQN